MLVSELIAELQEQMDKHGDLVVHYNHPAGDVTPTIVNTYTVDGKKPESDNPAVEIYIH